MAPQLRLFVVYALKLGMGRYCGEDLSCSGSAGSFGLAGPPCSGPERAYRRPTRRVRSWRHHLEEAPARGAPDCAQPRVLPAIHDPSPTCSPDSGVHPSICEPGKIISTRQAGSRLLQVTHTFRNGLPHRHRPRDEVRDGRRNGLPARQCLHRPAAGQPAPGLFAGCRLPAGGGGEPVQKLAGGCFHRLLVPAAAQVVEPLRDFGPVAAQLVGLVLDGAAVGGGD